MATHCPHCGHENPDFSIVCDNCSTQLAEPQAIIQELLDVQALLAQRQQDEMDILRQTMERVQAQLGLLNQEAPTPTEPTPVFEEPTPPEPIQHIQKEEIDHSWVEASLTADDTPLEATPTTTEEPGLAEDTHPVAAFVSRPMVAAPTPPQTEHTPTTSQEPWYKSLPAPLPDGFEVIRKSYQKYKEEGKLPIFFMTLAGGIALLYGIGYLMQYTLKLTGDYSEIIKVGMGFVAAAAALFIGIRLTKRDDQYREYGAMVMSLGIVLNYVMIYFLSDLGNFPTLSSSLVGFGLIVLNTGAGIGLALRFETRLIATLFLLGGAFAPFYLQSTDDGSSYYGYLWLLTAGTCFVAWRIRWRGLYQLAFGISSVLLEANAFLQEPDSGLFVVYYHLFAYLFFALLLVEKRRWKPQLDTYGLVMLSANVALLVINLFTVLDQTLPVLGWVYATNAALFLVAFLLPSREAQAQGRGMLILISGILLGVAIPAFFQQAFMGLFWSLEGLLLLFFGSRFRMGLVRKEGYALLVIAAGKLLWHSQEIVTQWGDTCWHLGLLNLAILLGVITTAWVGGIRTGQNLPSWEGTLLKGLGEVVPLLLSGLLLIISWHTIQEWTYPAAVALIVLLLGWGRWFRTQNTVGWSFVPLLILATGW
ncbi:MAG TPA: hypothetical protein DCE41_04965, partial [Cytophagales bacterium]|nr:hypothetical protein [Cytophagales bacterium]